jgi:undecaprenyl-diphosphatase
MIKYVFLGVAQGLTEFLPVSSSGHLVILQKLFAITDNQLAITIVLHLGTVLSLLFFFFKDILKLLRNIKDILLILLVTVITGIIGILGKDFFAGLFNSVKAVCFSLLLTGIILLLTRKIVNNKREKISTKDALILGITQGIAVIPGISRSGITISTLLFRKIENQLAFRFSFLAAIPAIFSASLLEAREIKSLVKTDFNNLAIGFIFSFLSGLLALYILRKILKIAKFYYFGYYCIIVALISFIFLR